MRTITAKDTNKFLLAILHRKFTGKLKSVNVEGMLNVGDEMVGRWMILQYDFRIQFISTDNESDYETVISNLFDDEKLLKYVNA